MRTAIHMTANTPRFERVAATWRGYVACDRGHAGNQPKPEALV